MDFAVVNIVTLGNRWDDVRRGLAGVSGPFRWLSVAHGDVAARISERLRGLANGEELSLTALARERRDDFRARYIEFLGAVNGANASKFWWTMPFTTKNPLSSPLCRNIFNFLLIADLVESDPRPLVVITDSPHLVAQVRAWARSRGVRAIGRVRGRQQWWRRVLREFTPAGAMLVAARVLLRWMQARQYLPPRLPRPGTVLVSVAHSHSFTDDGSYRDVYFGPLLDYLAQRGHAAFVIAVLLERTGEWLTSRFQSMRSAIPVVPLEACLSPGEIIRGVLHGLLRAIRPFPLTGPTDVGGRDVRLLLEGSIRRACRDGTVLMSIQMYYACSGLGRRMAPDRCVYPFENRAFEKMLLTGLREASPATRLIGYNHASITLSHTNFLLGSHEGKAVPLPDVVLTVGPIVSDWLEVEGRYPPRMFRACCALRQGWTASAALRPRRGPVTDVLLALASGLEEYIKALRFLEAAWQKAGRYRLRIRAHPEFRLEDALRVAGLRNRDFFKEDRDSLSVSLEQADVVLYASSTVGLEAVAHGIPTVRLDFGDFLETDPMFGWSELKWTVREPAALVATLREIEAVPDGEFRARQQRAQEYATRYLTPVTDAGCELFLTA